MLVFILSSLGIAAAVDGGWTLPRCDVECTVYGVRCTVYGGQTRMTMHLVE